LGRYGVESGHHRLVMSISAFDPKRSQQQSATFSARVPK
jgi:hypothetical protein